jgi:1,4-dihydroxy-2-naphthoyl-CoA synthase
LGLINELVDDGAALAGALALAEQIVDNSPTSVTWTIRAVQESADAAEAVGWLATARAIEHVIRSANAEEGLAAFLEKRDPRWIGS